MILNNIQSFECWKCEVTVQSNELNGVFFDDCQAQFDFTQHTRENCDGKCWKSVDLMDIYSFNNNNNTRNRSSSYFFRQLSFAKLKSSRRCFSANELLRAAEMGVNTSDGCRQVKRENKKIREICFCSDQDMCNYTLKFTSNFFILGIFIVFVYLNK